MTGEFGGTPIPFGRIPVNKNRQDKLRALPSVDEVLQAVIGDPCLGQAQFREAFEAREVRQASVVDPR